jgi:hypothetical protein
MSYLYFTIFRLCFFLFTWNVKSQKLFYRSNSRWLNYGDKGGEYIQNSVTRVNEATHRRRHVWELSLEAVRESHGFSVYLWHRNRVCHLIFVCVHVLLYCATYYKSIHIWKYSRCWNLLGSMEHWHINFMFHLSSQIKMLISIRKMAIMNPQRSFELWTRFISLGSYIYLLIF